LHRTWTLNCISGEKCPPSMQLGVQLACNSVSSLNAIHCPDWCNCAAHLGTYDYIDGEGHVIGFKTQVPLVKKWDEKYETSRVQNGFKWSPIKSYSRVMKRGINSRPWRLRIDSVARLADNYDGQEFVLIVTLSSIEGSDIYSEVIQLLRERGYMFNDIRTQSRVQQTYRV